MEDKTNIQKFEPTCLDINKIESILQSVSFPDFKHSVESESSIIISEDDSAFTKSSDCSEAFAISDKALNTFSEMPFINSRVANISKNKYGRISKTDSGILESENTGEDNLKFLGFHGIEQSLSEHFGDMTFDFNVKECYESFEDKEICSSVDFFNDPLFFNFTDNATSTVPSKPLTVRDSLYRKFDPLYVDYFSQHNIIPNEEINADKEEVDTKREKSPYNSTFRQNEEQFNASSRQSIGNRLISFDSPVIDKLNVSLSENVSVCDSKKLYTEEDLKKVLEKQELAMRGTFLRKQKDIEELFLTKVEELKNNFENQKRLSSLLYIILKEAMQLVNVFSNAKKTFELKLKKAEGVKNKLKEDMDTFVNDLQNIDSTFSDFYKEFEQSTAMLKLCVKNENLMKQFEIINMQLIDKEKIVKDLQNRFFEIIDASKVVIDSPNKSGKV